MLCQGGVGVSRGTAVGPVFIARRDADMLSFPEGAILVVERAFPRWAPLLPRAAGMVSEAGGMAGHLASVCREYRVPAVFGLKDACKLLEQGAEVTLDAGACRILRGAHPEIGQASQGLPKLMAGSPVMKMLEQVAECIVPLHLLDPKSPDFAPEKCTTLHDLTRFCHEKSADFMFNGDAGISERMGKQLKAGAKLQYWVVDMDRGFTRDVQGPVVDIKEIASTPMLALWDGMVAVPWAGPPMAASGFMSVVFESAMNPELEVTAANTMAERNYFIIDADYMLLQARYGYHFCTVEALAGEEAQENFVSFQFKGGAADVARRKLRTRLIADVLLPWGFNCDVKGDSLFAVAEGFTAEETLLRTKLVGYMLLHTRQSDVIMADDGQREAFRKKLEGDMKDIAEGRAGKKR